jgi:spoIIIJ-associated protein
VEWVETTGRTLDEAKDRALDQLGVDEDDAVFEIMAEPRPGLFGRVRGEARVRARIRPTHPRPKVDRRDRRRRRESPASGSEPAAVSEPPAEARPARPAKAPQQPKGTTVDNDNTTDAPAVDPAQLGADAVAFVETVVANFGLEASVVVEVTPEAVELDVQGDSVGVLIGPRGQTMIALQDLTRMAVQRRVGPDAPRLSVDVGSYRQRRHEALRRFAERVADEVLATGETRTLEPMSALDRKVVHDAINEIDGVSTTSDGEEPYRRVIVSPVG